MQNMGASRVTSESATWPVRSKRSRCGGVRPPMRCRHHFVRACAIGDNDFDAGRQARRGETGRGGALRVVAAPWGPLAACALGVGCTAAALVYRPRAELPPAVTSITPSVQSVMAGIAVAPAAWLRVASDGTMTECSATRAEVSKVFRLPPRDTRLLMDDGHAQPNFRPAILARERAALVLMRPGCRCVVSHTEAWVPESDGRALAEAMATAAVVCPHGHPFELRCLETALDMECSALSQEVAALEAEVSSLLPRLAERPSGQLLERAARLKGAIGRRMNQVDGLRSELARFLDDDSDMRSLDLSGGEVTSATARLGDDADVQEVEDLLETYYSVASGIVARVRLLDEAVEDTEAFVARRLDARRNVFIGVNLCFSAAAFADRLWQATVHSLRGDGQA